MDNKKETLSDIDRARALFEYEMTGVLLNFQNEAEQMQGDVISEYMEMAVPDPRFEYSAPDIEIENINVDVSNSNNTVDAVIIQADSPKISITEFVAIDNFDSLSLNVSSKVDRSSFVHTVDDGLFKKPVTAMISDVINTDMVKKSIVEEIVYSDVSDPMKSLNEHIAKLKAGYKVTIGRNLEVKRPPRKIRNILTHSNANSMRMKLPKSDVDLSVFDSFSRKKDVQASSAVFVSVSVSYPTNSIALNPLDLASDENERKRNIDVETISTGHFNPPHTETVTVDRTDFPQVTESHSHRINSEAITSGKIGITDLSVDVGNINNDGKFAVPEMNTDTDIKADYPIIPEMPDLSGYYQDILDSVKAEL